MAARIARAAEGGGQRAGQLIDGASKARVNMPGLCRWAQVQDKANLLSVLWTGVALFLSAFGGGPWSVDRCLLKKEF